RVLLDDWIGGAPFTTAHLTSISALVSAIGAGHYAWRAMRQGAVLAGLILGAVSFVATGYIVVSAGMRNAETATAKAFAATKAGDDRRAAQAEWGRLSAELGALGTPRSTQAVRAAMDAIVGDAPGQVAARTYRATRECTDITRDESAKACQPL